MKYKVSVIVPIFNVEKYIERCAQSLFEQTLDDIEYIFVDDASPDNSMAVLQTVIDRYPLRKEHVRILHHETNKGLPLARRTGIKAATGDYIQHVDSDDYIDSTMLEKLYKKAIEEDADIVVCDFYFKSETEEKVHTMVPNEIIENGTVSDENLTKWKVWPNVWAKLTRRQLYQQIPDKYYPLKNNAEDSVFSFLIGYYSKKIAYLQEPLYYYTINQESISRPTTIESKIMLQYERRDNFHIIVRFCQDHGIYDKYYPTIIQHENWGRNQLLNMLPNFRAWRAWLTIYPELNWAILFGNKHIHTGWKEKLWFAAIGLGLYPRLKNHLLSKKYRPDIIWRSGCSSRK